MFDDNWKFYRGTPQYDSIVPYVYSIAKTVLSDILNIDISDMAFYGEKENVLAVYVSTAEHESRWYEGGGIYRHVWLIKTESVTVDLWRVRIVP